MAEATSLQEFIGVILDREPLNLRVSAYRGHASSEFDLQPSIFRTAVARRNEHILLRELVAAHPADFSMDKTALEQLVRMQHYSLPTRLLDVSWNPLVALYFACQPQKRRLKHPSGGALRNLRTEADGVVFTFNVLRRRVRYFDSDKVACIANLSKLPLKLKDSIDTSLDMIKFNKTLPIKRLLHFVRQEKFQFDPEIRPTDLDEVVLVKPKQNNRRILAQDGAFFIFGNTDRLETGATQNISIPRITIPAKFKGHIIEELDKLAINEKTLFPEIDRAASYLTKNMATSTFLAKII